MKPQFDQRRGSNKSVDCNRRYTRLDDQQIDVNRHAGRTFVEVNHAEDNKQELGALDDRGVNIARID